MLTDVQKDARYWKLDTG